jgi:hypothetical protein
VPYDEKALCMQIGNTTNDPRVWTLIKTCISECISHHPAYCFTHKDDNAPTRILEWYGQDASLRVRLRELRWGSVKGYITLTHRWGNPDEYKIRLDTSSLAELRDGVLVSALLRTLEDALHAAMELDVQHLWIDILCIIQNDEDGWRRESGIMGQICQNGYPTYQPLQRAVRLKSCTVLVIHGVFFLGHG